MDDTGDRLEPRPLQFSTHLGDLDTPVVIDCDGADSLVVLEFDHRSQNTTRVRATSQGRTDAENFMDVALDMELGDFALIHLHRHPLRAFGLPSGEVHTLHNLRRGLLRSGITLGSLAIIPLMVLIIPSDTLRALLIALTVTIAIAAVVVYPRRLRSAGHVFTSAQGQWRLSQLLDERPALQAATADVDEIKEEYGRLLTDVVERIEHPALFDPAVDTTHRFTSALIQWDESGSNPEPAERSALAARVRITFDAARRHAQTVGMDHLPPEAREPANRAAKALRLATSSSSPAERESALRAGMRILDSLMLYYLPRAGQVQTMVEGRSLPALPGRRTSPEED